MGKSRLCSSASFNQNKLGHSTPSLTDESQFFRLDVGRTHCRNDVAKPLGSVAHTQPTAEAKQPLCRRANVVEGTFNLVTSGASLLIGAHNPVGCRFIWWIHRNHVKNTAARNGFGIP